ncbi:MAG TPA: hypothetical protein DD435_02805 [Cyanobacteria bacterium UBA8530]|nr:hypothetical protein [Cyanobacteria bacterium UBA8530]
MVKVELAAAMEQIEELRQKALALVRMITCLDPADPEFDNKFSGLKNLLHNYKEEYTVPAKAQELIAQILKLDLVDPDFDKKLKTLEDSLGAVASVN